MSVHYVKGDDPILRDAAADTLITGLLGDDDRSLTVEEFAIAGDGRADAEAGEPDDGDEEVSGTPFGAALNAARTPPMMTSKRIVVVRDVGNLASAELKMLQGYVEDPVETTELVLVTGGTARRASSTQTAVEKVAREGGSVTAPASEKPADVLTREERQARLSLRADAAKLLLAHVGDDAGLIPGLVQTLVSVHGEGAELGVDEVAPYLTDAGTIPMWDLSNAIERGDIPQALAVLQRLLTVTSPSQPKPLHPLEVMGFLHGHYRRLLRLDDPSIRTNEDAAAALGGRMSAKGAGFRLRQARALGTDGLRQAFDHLGRADLDIKGERAIPVDAVMSVLVARLAALTARSARAGARR
jgi:DNA polymerase III subunit delta